MSSDDMNMVTAIPKYDEMSECLILRYAILKIQFLWFVNMYKELYVRGSIIVTEIELLLTLWIEDCIQKPVPLGRAAIHTKSFKYDQET
jgi:hypothetical protein